jgi:hypothetical protein
MVKAPRIRDRRFTWVSILCLECDRSQAYKRLERTGVCVLVARRGYLDDGRSIVGRYTAQSNNAPLC